MSRKLLALSAAFLLTAGAQPVFAQNKTPPNSGIETLQAPTDVRPGQSSGTAPSNLSSGVEPSSGRGTDTGTGPSTVPGAGAK